MIGRIVNNYEIRSLIGEGGMGTVYLCEHTFITRRVAVKLLRPMYCEDSEIVARFMNEARAANAIGHPNIIDIIDVGRLDDGLPYLMMEYLEGETLAQRLRRAGRMSLNEALVIARQATAALGAAHAAGIVHRDLKPENFFLAGDAMRGIRLKVLDFGIAKLHDVAGANPVHTQGGLLGTPVYMSPEQCRGASVEVDARADVYALGTLLYEMLCGEAPFAGGASVEVLLMQLTATPRPPRSLNPDLPVWIEQVIQQALAKDPNDRFASMDALATALQAGVPLRPPEDSLAPPAAEAANEPSNLPDAAGDNPVATDDPRTSNDPSAAATPTPLGTNAAAPLPTDPDQTPGPQDLAKAPPPSEAPSPEQRAVFFEKTTIGIPIPPPLATAEPVRAEPNTTAVAPGSATVTLPLALPGWAVAPQTSASHPTSPAVEAGPFSQMLAPRRRSWVGPGLGGAVLLALLFVWAPWSPGPSPAPPLVSAARASAPASPAAKAPPPAAKPATPTLRMAKTIPSAATPATITPTGPGATDTKPPPTSSSTGGQPSDRANDRVRRKKRSSRTTEAPAPAAAPVPMGKW